MARNSWLMASNDGASRFLNGVSAEPLAWSCGRVASDVRQIELLHKFLGNECLIMLIPVSIDREEQAGRQLCGVAAGADTSGPNAALFLNGR